MTIRALCAAAVLCLPTTLLAESHGGPTQEQVDALVNAIAANGCTINGDTANAILAASGLDGDTAMAALDVLGEASEDPAAAVRVVRNADQTITLVNEACPAG